MVLDYVANGAGFIVEGTPTLNPEGLGHGDLYALDIVAVPDGLEHRVAEAEHQQVLHGLLAEVMVDSKDRGLVEHCMDRAVERLGTGQIAAKGLLDDDPRVPGATTFAQVLHHHRKHAGWYGQVVQRQLAAVELGPQGVEGGAIVVVSVDIAQQVAQLVECGRVHAPAMRLQAVAGTLAQPINGPARAGDADDGHVEVAAADHRLQRGEDLLVRKIACRTEKDEGVGGRGVVHGAPWVPDEGSMQTA